jgi:tRNA A37 threonylcarbamoyltransferase TsaD
VASRHHLEVMMPMIDDVVAQASGSLDEIEAVAITA